MTVALPLVSRSRGKLNTVAAMLALALVASACGADDDDKPAGTADATDAGVTDAGATDAGAGADGATSDGANSDGANGDGATADTFVDNGTATFKARGSVEQVFVTHAKPGITLELRDAAGKEIAKAEADKLGGLIFRKVPAGVGYKVHTATPDELSGPITVLSVAGSLPNQAFYAAQVIEPGNGYIKMRDGTTLAYFATLPGPAKDGPYPTIVNYSGYDPGRPGSKVVSKEQEFYCDAIPVLCDAPSDPNAMVAAVSGYATVSVNMRGTGCSGGAYDYFETLQLLDGYDIIEAVAAQPWVAFHKVGMVGLSYPGITQLFVAKMKPPSLAAITPVSVIGNTATTLVPGGILNKGFALGWIERVYKKAAPYGQGWEQGRVDGGDTVCAENQLLHWQRVNNVAQAESSEYYQPELIDPLNPSLFVNQIEVPVFLASAWQDEQTGPFFSTLLNQFTSAPIRRFVVYNGVHSDGFAPQVIAEWKAFLDIYVAHEKPSIGGLLELLVPEVTKKLYGTSIKMPASRWGNVKDYAAAKKQWESEPELQVLFDNGAPKPLGTPQAVFSRGFSAWPPTETKATRWYFQADGGMTTTAPTEANAASQFKLDPTAGDRGILKKGPGIWAALPAYDWKAPKAGFAVNFTTGALEKDLIMAGTGSVDIWVRSPVAGVTDADLEVNLAEVRADGQEMYVQSGWLRASHRKLKKSSTELWPEPTLVLTDIAPLKVGEWTQLRVGIAGFGHVFHKGSKIRISIDTPGDSRADWRFKLLTFKTDAHYDIGHDKDRPSSLVLPVLEGVPLPDDVTLATCPSLRGQPCRTFKAVDNVAVKP